jgi:hypothetical protein
MRRYDVYGFRTLNLEEAVKFVENALSIGLEERDSSYWGVYYRAGEGGARNFMVYENKVGQWHTPQYRGYRVILLVNNLHNMDEIQRKLTEGRSEPALLRSRTYPDEPPDDLNPLANL